MDNTVKKHQTKTVEICTVCGSIIGSLHKHYCPNYTNPQKSWAKKDEDSDDIKGPYFK